jgi:hypothetical protein
VLAGQHVVATVHGSPVYCDCRNADGALPAGIEPYYGPYHFGINDNPYPVWKRLRDETCGETHRYTTCTGDCCRRSSLRAHGGECQAQRTPIGGDSTGSRSLHSARESPLGAVKPDAAD